MLTPDWRPQVDSVRVMRMNLPEWPYILLGLLGSIVMGGAMPVYAILFGEVIHPHIYRVNQKKGRSQNIIVFHELLSLGCINFKNLCAHHQEEVLRFPKHPQLVKFG